MTTKKQKDVEADYGLHHPFAVIVKRFDFDAAHWLPKVPKGHKCRRLHGHTYVVEVRLWGPIKPSTGMVLDYADIAAAWEPTHRLLDHRCLNKIPGLKNPTTENLALFIVQHLDPVLPSLTSVRVYESSTTYCEVLK